MPYPSAAYDLFPSTDLFLEIEMEWWLSRTGAFTCVQVHNLESRRDGMIEDIAKRVSS